jgi:hypothetical protein
VRKSAGDGIFYSVRSMIAAIFDGMSRRRSSLRCRNLLQFRQARQPYRRATRGYAFWDRVGNIELRSRNVSDASSPLSVADRWKRHRVPLDWAMTQNNLGTALKKLGERESGTAHLLISSRW